MASTTNRACTLKRVQKTWKIREHKQEGFVTTWKINCSGADLFGLPCVVTDRIPTASPGTLPEQECLKPSIAWETIDSKTLTGSIVFFNKLVICKLHCRQKRTTPKEIPNFSDGRSCLVKNSKYPFNFH